MKKNGCALEQVDEFCCHEGGGLTAMINGEEVLCGSSGFMHLMTQGRGSFTLEFVRYEEAPQNVQQKVIEDAKKQAEAEQ